MAASGEFAAEIGLLVVVSITHMSMPNHWLPYALVGRAQGWTMSRTLFISASSVAWL
jgi:hypothetical protein